MSLNCPCCEVSSAAQHGSAWLRAEQKKHRGSDGHGRISVLVGVLEGGKKEVQHQAGGKKQGDCVDRGSGGLWMCWALRGVPHKVSVFRGSKGN